jgi:hypothetical protein
MILQEVDEPPPPHQEIDINPSQTPNTADEALTIDHDLGNDHGQENELDTDLILETDHV